MSDASRKLSMHEIASDWLNPIFVKETRQALKSRQFIATFLLLLVASWLTSSFGMLIAGTGIEYHSNGRWFFFAYYVILAFAIFIVVPFGAFRSVISERDLFTFELLSITTLKPRQVVSGKLQSAVLQVFIYYSAITPFIAFTYLLKGIDVLTIAFVLAVSLFWSLAISMAALGISTIARQRTWQSLLTILVLIGLIIGWSYSLAAASASLYMSIPFDHLGFWELCGIVALYAVLYFWLFVQLAIAQLTFDADNRSTGVRLAVASLFWATVALGGYNVVYVVPIHGAPGFTGVLNFWSLLMVMHWLVLGLVAATEPDSLSRRIRRRLPRFWIVRLGVASLLPGGARGLLFVAMHLGVLWLVIAWIVDREPSIDVSSKWLVGGACCYALVYLGLASALARWGRAISSDFRPAHARVLVLLFAAVGSIVPHMLRILEIRRMEFNQLHFLTDPVSTLNALEQGSYDRNRLMVPLAIAGLVCLLINGRAVAAGVASVVRSPAQPPTGAPEGALTPALDSPLSMETPAADSLPTSA